MKVSWDIINKMQYNNIKNKWYMNGRAYLLSENCISCDSPFFYNLHNTGKYCSKSCSQSSEHNSFYGKHHTEEHKKFISDIHKNKIVSEETKKKISKVKKGIKKSEEHRRKLSEAMKGKNNPWYGQKRPEHSKKMTRKNNPIYGISRYGENNPNWRGGISFLPYGPNWSKKLKDVIKYRDKYKCSNFLCYNSSNDLTIHHINYNKLNCSTNNLITLCRNCNSKANVDRNWHSTFYMEILKRKEVIYHG